ncbi:hypothetical protein BH11BAC2_BH11BAC2_08950 [soil metagenome]
MRNRVLYKNPAPNLRLFVVLILVLRIISYFMLSEDVSITQALKAGLRVGLTVTVISACILQQFSDKKPHYKYSYPLPMWLYGAYLLFGTLSLLWTTSVNSSVVQLAMDLEGFVFAFFFMRMVLGYQWQYPGGYFDLPKVMAPAISTIAIGFFIGMYINPDLFYRLTHGGSEARLGGFIINPNELGMLLVVGFATLLPLLQKDGRYRISRIILIIGLMYLVVLTGSRSSFAGMMLVLAVYAGYHQSKYLKFVLGGAIAVMIPAIGYSVFVKQGDVQEVMNMTGRIPFWRDLLTYNFPKEPWIGYGYMRIDYSDKFESLNAYAGAMTHNTFLQVLLGLGLVGLLIVFAQLSTFFHALRSHKNKMLSQQAALIFIPILINSFTEFGIFGETNYGILFYLFLIFSLSVEPVKAGSRIIGRPDTNAKQPDLSFRPATAA